MQEWVGMVRRESVRVGDHWLKRRVSGKGCGSGYLGEEGNG